MTSEAYAEFTDRLRERLAGDERVVGLVALGSMAAVDYEPDEYRTSKVCHCCDEVIHKVTVLKPNAEGEMKTREVRGLRWCSTSRRFLDRDFNAAINILRCGATGGRTENTTRDSEKVARAEEQKSFRLGGTSRNNRAGSSDSSAGRPVGSIG